MRYYVRQKMACGVRISDWISDVYSADLWKHVMVTAGPTHEPIDPVRVIANRSSGKQWFASAEALATLGAKVTLVAGPVSLATPAGADRIDLETARELESAVSAALPAEAAVLVAAVAAWPVDPPPINPKKGHRPPTPRCATHTQHLPTPPHTANPPPPP